MSFKIKPNTSQVEPSLVVAMEAGNDGVESASSSGSGAFCSSVGRSSGDYSSSLITVRYTV